MTQERTQQDTYDIASLFGLLWQGKWWLIGFVVFFAVASVVFVLLQPNQYRGEIRFVPSEESQAQGAQMGGQLGGLASLAGMNLGALQQNKHLVALEILRSRDFLTNFIDEHDLLVPLFAVERWDEDTGEIVIDRERYNPDTDTWLRKGEPVADAKPTMWQAVNAFRLLLEVEEDPRTSVITLGVFHQSPLLASEMANLLIRDLNRRIQMRDLEDAERNLAYLSEALEESSISSIERMIFQLIEQEMQTLMLANARIEYAFETIDPAVVPEQHAKPNRTLIVIVSTFFGGVLGVLFVLFRNIVAPKARWLTS